MPVRQLNGVPKRPSPFVVAAALTKKTGVPTVSETVAAAVVPKPLVSVYVNDAGPL